MTPDPAEVAGSPSTSTPGHLARAPEVFVRVFESAPDAQFFVGADGRIVEVNTQATLMFGYAREELIGQPVEILIPSRFVGRHVEYRAGYVAAPRARPMGAGVDLYARRKDGSELPVDIMLSPLDTGHGRLALAVVRDITERKRVEARANEVRQMYFRELHHRVKNNLQVISSLLFLQSTYTSDPGTREILTESRCRVKSIALIHEKFYRSPEHTRIDFADYLRDLIDDLFRTYGVNPAVIAVRTAIAPVSLEIDTAIPCGLIVNELVSNAFKHAFPAGRAGALSVELAPAGPGQYRLVVADDGVGLPPGFDWRASPSLGLKLVVDLTRQLDGQLDMEARHGTTFRITVRDVPYKERS